MQGNPCYARLFADLPYNPPGGLLLSLRDNSPCAAKADESLRGGQSRAPPVAGGARRKPSEQGSARKAPRADAARLLRTALRPPSPQGFLDKLAAAPFGAAVVCGRLGGGGGGGGVLRPKAAKQAGGRATPGCRRVGAAHPPPPPPGRKLQHHTMGKGNSQPHPGGWLYDDAEGWD